MYNSPIKIYETAMQTIMEERENAIFAKVQSAFDVDVDKDELIRALQYDRGQYEKGYADGKADAVQQWIPVTERLPDANAIVMTWSEATRDMELASRLEYFEEDEVTHWMPLPQPPKEG